MHRERIADDADIADIERASADNAIPMAQRTSANNEIPMARRAFGSMSTLSSVTKHRRLEETPL